MVKEIFCSRFVLHTWHNQSIYWQPERDNLQQRCDLVWHVWWLLHPRRQPSPPPQLHNPAASWACSLVRPWSSQKVHLDNGLFSSRSCTGVGWPRRWGGPQCGHRCISLLPSDSFGQSFGWCLWPGVGIPFVPNAPHHATGSLSYLLRSGRMHPFNPLLFMPCYTLLLLQGEGHHFLEGVKSVGLGLAISLAW